MIKIDLNDFIPKRKFSFYDDIFFSLRAVISSRYGCNSIFDFNVDPIFKRCHLSRFPCSLGRCKILNMSPSLIWASSTPSSNWYGRHYQIVCRAYTPHYAIKNNCYLFFCCCVCVSSVCFGRFLLGYRRRNNIHRITHVASKNSSNCFFSNLVAKRIWTHTHIHKFKR